MIKLRTQVTVFEPSILAARAGPRDMPAVGLGVHAPPSFCSLSPPPPASCLLLALATMATGHLAPVCAGFSEMPCANSAANRGSPGPADELLSSQDTAGPNACGHCARKGSHSPGMGSLAPGSGRLWGWKAADSCMSQAQVPSDRREGGNTYWVPGCGAVVHSPTARSRSPAGKRLHSRVTHAGTPLAKPRWTAKLPQLRASCPESHTAPHMPCHLSQRSPESRGHVGSGTGPSLRCHHR